MRVRGKQNAEYALQTFVTLLQTYLENNLLELSMYFTQSTNTDRIRGTNQEFADINLPFLLLKVLTTVKSPILAIQSLPF